MRTRRGVSNVVVIGAVVIVVIIAVGGILVISPFKTTSSTTTSTTTTSVTTSSPSRTTTSTTSSSTSSSSTTSIPTVTVNDTALYQAALKEGSVVVYGSPTAQQFANVTAAFNAVYPGITVDYTSYQPPQAVPLIESQLATQGYSADIAFQAATTVYPLEQQGYAIPYISPYVATFPNAVLDPLNESTPIIQLAIGWVYNTAMIKPANVPTTMAQVANAQFNGEIVMSDPTTGTAFTQYWASLEGYLGNATVINFLTALKAATNPVVYPTTVSCANDVAAGFHAICLTAYMQEAAPDIQACSCMKFLNITGLPIMITPSNSMIIKNAQHPNAAKLLTDFMASPAGQIAWGNVDVRTPVNPNVNARWSFSSELKTFDPGAGPQVYFPTPAIASSATAWATTYKNLGY